MTSTSTLIERLAAWWQQRSESKTARDSWDAEHAAMRETDTVPGSPVPYHRHPRSAESRPLLFDDDVVELAAIKSDFASASAVKVNTGEYYTAWHSLCAAAGVPRV